MVYYAVTLARGIDSLPGKSREKIIIPASVPGRTLVVICVRYHPGCGRGDARAARRELSHLSPSERRIQYTAPRGLVSTRLEPGGCRSGRVFAAGQYGVAIDGLRSQYGNHARRSQFP